MLSPDGISLLEPYLSTYAEFLANQVADLMAYFASRNSRASGDVTVDDESPSTPHGDRNLNWGTPSTSGILSSSLLNNNSPKGPRVDDNLPRSGVI
jgi:hypothetical protein